jgi:putative membrane protein
MERKIDFYKIALFLLIAMHIAGLIGLLHPVSRAIFEQLIAFNLLVTSGIVFFFHKEFNTSFFLFCTITLLAGYFVEVVGVQSGVIFGQYTYGAALGYKLLNVPLLIGLNWLVLIYCTNVIAHKLNSGKWVKALAGACLMVLLDFVIEPMAIRHGLWEWQHNQIPVRNYIGWFITSLLLSGLFHILNFNKNNHIAPVMYIVQFLFFLGLLLLF